MSATAVINHKIEKSNAELIGDKIGCILFVELENQACNYEPIADVEAVTREKTNPEDVVKLSSVNVSLDNSNFDNKNYAGAVDGHPIFNVDVYVKHKSTRDGDGDQEAQYRLQRLLYICRAILEDLQYKTLGFTVPFIKTTMVLSIGIREPNPEDVSNCAMGRLVFQVIAVETTELKSAITIESMITGVKLGLTEKGYQYEYAA